VQSGETRVSVYEGEATLDGAQPVRLRAGERVYARRGEVEEGPTQFDRTEADEFAEWDDGRQEQTAYAANRQEALPDDVAPYADELDRHGAWYYETEVGHVWRPYVAAGWQPYSNGRWTWSVFGWTWVPYESWGWAVSHYGRWGFAPALGWYWIPGATWAPAWVSWAVGGDYVGWCPLGYRDRPVLVYDRLGRGNRGHAVPRSGTSVAETPWIYLRRGDVGARDLTRRRVQLDGNAVQQVRILETAQARLTRDLGVTDAAAMARAVPRNTSSRPQMSDTVPEMRGDPMTQIPIARRRGRPADGRDDFPAESGSVAGGPSGAVQRFGGSSGGATGRGDAAASTPLVPVPAARAPHPTDVRSGQRRAEDAAETGAITRRGGRSADVEAHTPDRPVREREGGVAREREGASDAEREVLRPMFRGLGRQRTEGREAAPPRDGGSQAEEGGWARRRGDGGERRDGGDAAGRRGGDSGAGRSREGVEARPAGSAREREAAPRPNPPARSEPPPQAQPRHEAPPPPAAAARRRKDQ